MEWPADFPHDHAFVNLLVPGVSSDMDMEQLLRDTEEKLKLNAYSIEQSLKELQAKMGDSRRAQRPSSTTECMQWFNLRSPSSAKPAPTGHQELMDFLRSLQRYLRSEQEGREDLTLQLLLSLSSQCCVSFPRSPSLSSTSAGRQTASSAPAVHTIIDNTSLEFQEVWDEVRLRLRRHLSGRLSSCSPDPQGPGQVYSLSVMERLHCLQKMSFLYPDSEVLTHYQGLRSQSVLGVLSSALSSSPGAEDGFDQLAVGFSSVVRALPQAIREDLHVLVGLADPHAVLSFLNAAYLSTVVGKLTSMVERQCTNTFKDSNAASSRTRRYSAKSRASVAPMELPVKGRNISLTSHQLRALTQLASNLLWLETSVEDLATNVAFINCSGETLPIKGILKKAKEKTEEDASKATGEHVQHIPEARVLQFDWRSAFQGLVPQIAHCVQVVLEDVCTNSLQQEEVLHSSGHTFITLSKTSAHAPRSLSDTLHRHDSSHSCSERHTPKMIAKFCGVITEELDALLPLAVACGGCPLLEVRSSFVEACSTVTSAMLGRLEERALEVPASAPLKNLPTLLASSIYVHQQLIRYQASALTPLPINKCQDTVKALREQLTSYCHQVCSTSILHDAESHHWADSKPFFEGERCSFSVQMWFYFLCGLRSDLWAVLPPDWARELLGQVLCETLQVLVQRYARARPSYKRHLQVRCDITALLLYVEQLMWSICDSLEALVHRDTSSIPVAAVAGGYNWPSRIHGLCDQLLTVLVITTSPLSMLYGTFISVPDKESTCQHPGSAGARWLNAINPELFTEQSIRDGLMGQAASECQLRLLTSDPGSSPSFVLQTLLYRDCYLLRILLENSHFCDESGSEVTPENRKAGDDFIVGLFDFLSSLNDAPKALTQALEPYLDTGQIWEHLCTLADVTRTVPALVSCVRAAIAKTTRSLLAHLVSMVMSYQPRAGPGGALYRQDIPASILAKVPKEWNYTPQEPLGREATAKSVTSIAIQALSFILTNLPMAVASLPLPVRFLFRAAEKRLSQHARQLRSVGLLPWAILGCLVQGLEDPDTLGHIAGLALDRGAKECLALLAQCLQATMGIQQKGVPKAEVHKVLQALEENRPKWTAMKIQSACKLYSDSVFHRGGEGITAVAELTEQKIGLMLLEACHKAGGSDYLRRIYRIIQGNEELLLSKFSGNTDLPDGVSRLVKFDLGTEGHVAPAQFNPLTQFDHVGRKKLDQSAVADRAWDWARLLPAYQDVSRVTFTSLLANRWEMQDGANLDDEETSLVEKLQKHFFSHSSPGPHDCPEAPHAQQEAPLSENRAPQ